MRGLFTNDECYDPALLQRRKNVSRIGAPEAADFGLGEDDGDPVIGRPLCLVGGPMRVGRCARLRRRIG
jgi:hypothetical protein